MTQRTYSLSDIYQAKKENQFSLPTVQRGFVWKPYQIENLWDSLLRGYPVGSIVLSPKIDKSGFEILDGQQRLSSICLGMYNPDSPDSSDVFKTSYDNIRVFIDLAKPDSDDNRKYIFRIVTRSHPWGYNRKDNKKPLESKEKRQFLEKLKDTKNIFEENMNKFYPFDAYKPIPINLFMNAKNSQEVKSKFDEWMVKFWKGAIERKNRKLERSEYKIEEIFDVVQKIKRDINIPALYLNFSEMLNNNKVSEPSNIDIEEDNDNKRFDEIENMFVRMNAGGTPLSGEELNYSILKAHIDNKTQKRIEYLCQGLLQPARFITLVYRLWKMEGKKKRTFYRLAVKPKDFQRSIRKNSKKNEFINFIDTTDTVLNTIKDILIYNDKNNKYGLPFITVFRLSDHVPEVIFILMYRLYTNGDFTGKNYKTSSSMHRKILGIVTLFTWLGKGKQKDHSQLLRNIFPAMMGLNQKRFWSWETVQRASLPYKDNDVLISFPLFEELEHAIMKMIESDNRGKTKQRAGVNEELRPFVEKIFFNKDLLLYAQKNYLYRTYDSKHFMLDDTNVPFDWDHIFPQSFVKYSRKVPRSLKDWYHSNGNFWACPYELNRSFGDDAPCKKFKEISIYRKSDKLTIKDVFLQKGDVDAYFNEIDDGDSLIRNWKMVYEFILIRNLQICKKWYKNLLVDELNPNNNQKTQEKIIRNYLDKRKFKINEGDSDQFDRRFEIAENLYLYIHYYYCNELQEEGIEFGLSESNGNILSKVRDPKDGEGYRKEDGDNESYLYQYFTLTSNSKEAYQDLFREMKDWLTGLPEIEIDGDLANIFEKALRISVKDC
jgi:hypothetical protein